MSSRSRTVRLAPGRPEFILCLSGGLVLAQLWGCSRADALSADENSAIRTEEFVGRAAPAPPELTGQAVTAKQVLVKAEGQLGPGRGTLVLEIQPPEGAKLTEGAPLRLSGKGKDVTFPEKLDAPLDLSRLPLRFPLDVADGAQGPVELDLTYHYCTKGDRGSCRPLRQKLTVDIDMSGSAAGGEAHLIHRPGV